MIGGERGRFFEKKRRKKLFGIETLVVSCACAWRGDRFGASFFKTTINFERDRSLHESSSLIVLPDKPSRKTWFLPHFPDDPASPKSYRPCIRGNDIPYDVIFDAMGRVAPKMPWKIYCDCQKVIMPNGPMFGRIAKGAENPDFLDFAKRYRTILAPVTA
jgi:hypothetical protein